METTISNGIWSADLISRELLSASLRGAVIYAGVLSMFKWMILKHCKNDK